jgi:hypothetical protein
MKKLLLIALLLLLMAAVPSGAGSRGSVVEENVYVTFEYLTDDEGYNYGANYFLNSTVDDTVCAVPKVDNQDNVDGDVASPVLLQPNESHVLIGSFRVRDNSQPWSVNVSARWKRGGC